MSRPRTDPAVAADAFEGHPLPTLVLDASLSIVQTNAAARAVLRAGPGAKLGEALGCLEAAGAPGGCGTGARCAGCAFRDAAERAVAGTAAQARGFVLRPGGGDAPADLHLLAFTSPLRRKGAPHAVLALVDANQLVSDPALLPICSGCGRVRDEEGAWHALHRYLEDHLGVEVDGELCDSCRRRVSADR